MLDQRVVSVFPGAPQSYMMEVERRLTAAQANIASGAAGLASLTSTVTDLAATVDGLALNYGFGEITGSFSTTSTSMVDITSLSCSITTTGGPVLVIVAGGSLSNADTDRNSIVGLQIDSGTTFNVSDMLQSTGVNTDDIFVPLAGLYVFTGIAAGAHTCKARLRTTNAASAAIISGDSRVSIFALELAL